MTGPISQRPAASVPPGPRAAPPPGPGQVPGEAPPPRPLPGSARASAAQLALLQALLRAGDYARAAHLLETLGGAGGMEEHCWYARLWLLAGEGRVEEALHLAREAGARLPGSAAVAWLQAVLERAGGDRQAAVESALRAAAILPGVHGPEAVLTALLAETDDEGAPPPPPGTSMEAPEPPPPAPWLDLTRAALTGAAWLHPFGSGLSYQQRRVFMPNGSRAAEVEPRDTDPPYRLWLLGVATIAAAIYAVFNPLLAAAGLALVVAVLSRPRRR